MHSTHLRWIPNFLSVSRIFFALAFPLVPASFRIPLIALALMSEFFDGYLARKLNAISALGTALDPIADKLFIFFTVSVLIAEGRLSWIDFSLIAMRDITVAIGALSLTAESRGRAWRWLAPRRSGKVTTALQFLLLISFYLHWPWTEALLVVTAISSSISAIDYLYWILHLKFDLKRRDFVRPN